MDKRKQDKIIQDVKFLFGNFINKYPFVEVYCGFKDSNDDCLLVNIKHTNDIKQDNAFWDKLYEIQTLLIVNYDNDILFTRNEELFKILFNKKKVEPVDLNNMTLKEKIEKIIELIKSIQEEYKIGDIYISDIMHPRNPNRHFGKDDIVTISYEKSKYDNTDKIVVRYFDDEGMHETFFTEFNNLNDTTTQSADTIINALNMARIYYHRSNDIVHKALMNNGETLYDLSVFNHLFAQRYNKVRMEIGY